MDPEMTAEQKNNLKDWAEKRDSILSEISILKTERENLQKTNRNLSFSNSDIEARMNEVKGRIEELKIKEKELELVVSKKISYLQSEKNTLEAQITSLLKTVELLSSQKTSLQEDVSFIMSNFNIVKSETSMLEKVVDRVTMTSKNNTLKIDTLVKNLASSLEEIIEVNKKNVLETNIVIDKVPKMIMEAQKHGLINNKI